MGVQDFVAEGIERNAFEALCFLASDEEWSCKLYGTGYIYFRYALLELMKGSHPDDGKWVTSRRNRGRLEKDVGGILSLEDWGMNEMVQLQKICEGADISRIAKQCRYPDWLNYLAVVIWHVWQAEVENKLLTMAWGPGLVEMLPEDSMYRISIGNKANGKWPLHLEDLGRIEREIDRGRWNDGEGR